MKRMEKPRYAVGEVIDLRFSRDRMPDRIAINKIYVDCGSTDNEWLYVVDSEKNYKQIVLRESQIDSMRSKKSHKCYEHKIVKEMYESGYRFCGNGKADTVKHRAEVLKNAQYIHGIVLRSAVDVDGNIIDGYLGLWVQYNLVIAEPQDNVDSINDGSYYRVIK